MKPIGALVLALVLSVTTIVGCASTANVTTSSPKIIQNIAGKLPGKWRGKVDDKDATLIIYNIGTQLSGKIICDGVEEKLFIEMSDDGQITLKGVNYQILTEKPVCFALDTFYGTLSSYGNSMNGNYVDQVGNRGNWFVTKEDIAFTQPALEAKMQPQPPPYYTGNTTIQAPNEETVPYPVYHGPRSSYETTSLNVHNDYVKESRGRNWWSRSSFHFRSSYRKTSRVRTYTTHRHYHWGH